GLEPATFRVMIPDDLPTGPLRDVSGLMFTMSQPGLTVTTPHPPDRVSFTPTYCNQHQWDHCVLAADRDRTPSVGCDRWQSAQRSRAWHRTALPSGMRCAA